jgi:hypothetical protein
MIVALSAFPDMQMRKDAMPILLVQHSTNGFVSILKKDALSIPSGIVFVTV